MVPPPPVPPPTSIVVNRSFKSSIFVLIVPIARLIELFILVLILKIFVLIVAVSFYTDNNKLFKSDYVLLIIRFAPNTDAST
jgi:hypothetical protein